MSEAKPAAGAGISLGRRVRAWIRERSDEVLGCDLRSLAAMRIGLGLSVLMDLYWRAADLEAFYGDDGVMPREYLLQDFTRDIYVSFHMMSGTWQFEAVLFAINAVFGLMLLVGFRTRLATWACWLMLVSLQVRNPLVLQSGDVVLRLVLFWCLFLPLGARASVDAAQRASPAPPPTRFTSVATVGLGVQLSCIYIFTAILKTGRQWWDGTAVTMALQIDHFATPFGKWLLTLPDPVLHGINYSTLAWEFGGAALLLVPFFFGPVRTFTVFGFIGLHIGFKLGLEIGLFSWICSMAWLAFLPGWFWDRFSRWPATTGPRMRPSLSHNLLGLGFLALILSWNISTIDSKRPVPSEVRWIGQVMRLDQKWNMFAPYPMKDDGWFVLPGTLRDGREIDLYDGGPTTGLKPFKEISYDKPELISGMYPNQRWRKYMRNIWLKKYKKARLPYGKYVCRSWNRQHKGNDTLKTFKIIFMREDTLPNKEEKEPREVKIWSHDCFKSVQVEDSSGSDSE